MHHRNARFLWLAVLLVLAANTHAGDRPTSTVPKQGVRSRLSTAAFLRDATVVTQPGHVLEKASIVIENGVITRVGTVVDPPNGAEVIDMNGKTIYPALIDPYVPVKPTDAADSTGHWNKHVRPERDAADAWTGSSKSKQLRELGFALQTIVPDAGVIKGASSVVTTEDNPSASSVITKRVANHLRLTSPRGANRKYYPNSPMGAVALARQTFYDAEWYTNAQRAYRHQPGVARPETNSALESLSKSLANDELFIFDAPDEQYVGRAHRFAIEFNLHRVAIRGSGHEYELLDAIAAMNRPIIVPVNFPKPPNVSTVEATRDATLYALLHWHFAPENAARLHNKGVTVLLTSQGLDNVKDFTKQVRLAVKRGLPADIALQACTLEPAKLYGIDNKAGSIEVGKAANLMVTSGDWLDEDTDVLETWIDGSRFRHKVPPNESLVGDWKLSVPRSKNVYLSVVQKDGKFEGRLSKNELASESSKPKKAEGDAEGDGEKDGDKKDENTPLKKLDVAFNRLTAQCDGAVLGKEGTIRLSATYLQPDTLIGDVLDAEGKRHAFRGKRILVADQAAEEQEDKMQAEDTLPKLEIAVLHPLGNYGVVAPAKVETVLFENATIWTCGPEGTLENASVLIEDGRIAAVGKFLNVPSDVKRINVKGKHITPGIIDCHSHMATDGGVNESTQAITAEVRIGDFINAFDMSIYQQLAGGVTTANVLHGSANPIGGQNQVIKLRWGKLPEELKFVEAPAGIKFALGENVKQSNWGDDFTSRYPQSRLGVEQIMRDALLAAQQYEREWQQWEKDGKGIPPRKDLELDALLEILHGKRWIHCHSYRQDEILALIRTLDSFDVTIGTFQHILEGYKVAKEMAEHGAMGSAFSDWWGYKFEVFDAIPYNGSLMHDAGIVVSFNSDDRELARHLNHEAAKAVKYGGVSREEALKFVTLNPAKQLRIDEHVGSLEVGKHADLVVWSDDPLQITSRCEQTWVDGCRYFDIDEEKTTRAEHEALRQQLIQRVIQSGQPMKPIGETEKMWRDLFPYFDEYCGHHGHDEE